MALLSLSLLTLVLLALLPDVHPQVEQTCKSQSKLVIVDSVVVN